VKININKYCDNNLNKLIFIKGKVENTLNDEIKIPSQISLQRLDTDFHDSIKNNFRNFISMINAGGCFNNRRL